MSSRDWHDPPQDPLYEQKNIFGELITRELEIIWEHSFAKVPPGEGITDKFFEYSAGVTRDGPSVVVGEGEYIRTKEVGDYGGGQPVVPGGTFNIAQQPSGDQDAWVGYSDQTDGIGLGVKDFNDGEAGATAAGPQPYVFFERAGDGRTIVPQEHWNLNTLTQAADEGPPLDLTDGVTVRLPHACYYHSQAAVELGVKLADGGFALVPIHEFNHKGGPMWSMSDQPMQMRVTGTEANGFEARLTTIHYEGETGRSVKRATGEAWTPQKNGGAALPLNAYPDWTYIIGFRKRTGWGKTDITPMRLNLNATQHIEAQVTVGGTYSGQDFTVFPEDTSGSERAVDYDLNRPTGGTETTITDRGRREWIDFVPGDKQEPVQTGGSLDNVVTNSDEVVALLARPATGNATDINGAALSNGAGF